MIWFILFLAFALWYWFHLKNQLQSWTADLQKDLDSLVAAIERRNDHSRIFLKALMEQPVSEASAFQHLSQTLDAWDQARSANQAESLSSLALAIQTALTQLMDRLNQYAFLKDHEEIQRLMTNIPVLSEAISTRITLYNKNSEFYNQEIKKLPYSLVAEIFHLKPRSVWEPL